MSEAPIKVLLVDDEQLIRTGLSILLDTYNDVEVAGQAANGQEAAAYCSEHKVDVVLMDIRMPVSDGIEGTHWIKSNDSDIKVLILTTFQDAEYISQAMRLGASGYLLKDSSSENIYEAIKMVNGNNIVLDGKIGKEIVALTAQSNTSPLAEGNFNLSKKEINMIQLVASGLSNQEIAKELYLTVGTIKNNISALLRKLDLRDRTQLAIFAFEEGLMN